MSDTIHDPSDRNDHHTTVEVHWAPIPEAVLYDPSLGDKAVRVYGTLMRHGLDPSTCHPSHVRLAELVGCAPRSIQRPLRELEEAGWIERVPRFDAFGQRMTDGFHVRSAGGEDGLVLDQTHQAAQERGMASRPSPVRSVVEHLAARDGWLCHYCAVPLGWGHDTLTPPDVEHVLPRSRGGSGGLANLVLACGECNSDKGARTPTEWTGAPCCEAHADMETAVAS